jgi:hypothetical protein
MVPTCKLRWLIIEDYIDDTPNGFQRRIRTPVLQQWWESGESFRATDKEVPGEWRMIHAETEVRHD